MIRNLFMKRRSGVQLWTMSKSFCQGPKICWSCNGSLSGNSEIFCSKCQTIQKIPKIVSFSEIFQIVFRSYLSRHICRITSIYLALTCSIQLMLMTWQQSSEIFKVKFIQTSFQGRATRNKTSAQNGARSLIKLTRLFNRLLREVNIY